jgi:drug/metabolite transporter (DMT)-like permease
LAQMKREKLAWILFIFLSLTWGSSFILMKKSMFPSGGTEAVLGPIQVGSLRILIAALVLLPLAIHHIRKLTRKNFGFILITGVLGNFFPALLFTLAQTRIDSSMAGILNMGTSFFVIIIGIIIYKSIPSRRQIIGLLLGTAGVIMLLKENLDFSMGDLNYALLILLATLFYATSLTTIKFKLTDVPAAAITSISFLIILLPALAISICYDSFDPIINHPEGLKGFGFILILAVVGTAVAVLLFTKLIEISNPIFASAVAYMLPVVAIFIGLLDGEDFGIWNYLFVPAILIGVYLMNRRDSEPNNSSQKS